MARTQFTFTFTNAQPGSVVSFDNIDADHLFAAATGGARLGHPLVLNAQNAISVWSDAAQLTATTEDGAGNNISATATVANPSVTTADGTAGQNPFSSGTSGQGDSALWRRSSSTDATSGSFDFVADMVTNNGSSVSVDDSSGWVGSWGYPVPKITEAGIYSIVLSAIDAASGVDLHVDCYDSSGAALSNLSPDAAHTVPTGTGVFDGRFSTTLYLPADTHFDMGVASGPSVQLMLFIQRVG